MADDRDWTPGELIAELRARERARGRSGPTAGRARSAGGGGRTKVGGVVPRFRRIDEIPSRELARRAAAMQRAIYGVDDRRDTREVTDARTRPLVEASLALVEVDDLTQTGNGRWTLRTTSYQKEYELCSAEAFASQPLGCFCSGVLVAPDIIATAGHCVKKKADLDRMRFVFGFRMKSARTARTTFAADDVYQGTAIIGRKLTDDGTDWALVRLDRPVVGRTPVAFRSTGKVKSNDSVFVIGHPCGLPQKIARGARVRRNSDSSYFVANLDTYGGNSGSPVFNSDTYQLEGLLVRGETDFVSTGSCNVSMVFPTTGGGGEDVSRTTEWTALVPKAVKDGAGTAKAGASAPVRKAVRKAGRSTTAADRPKSGMRAPAGKKR